MCQLSILGSYMNIGFMAEDKTDLPIFTVDIQVTVPESKDTRLGALRDEVAQFRKRQIFFLVKVVYI